MALKRLVTISIGKLPMMQGPNDRLHRDPSQDISKDLLA